VVRTRKLHRQAREREPYHTVALVGYTNAGKSTLFNRLTGAQVEAVDKLFATLDPTMRLVALPSGLKAILSDTVGFISDLPTTLVAAFRATLEEVTSADLVLHVRDISHPENEAQRHDVARVLDELGIGEAERAARVLEVWNKLDRLGDNELAARLAEAARSGRVVMTSARDGRGIPELLGVIDHQLLAAHAVVELQVPVEQGELLAWLHERCEVLDRDDRPDGVHLRVAFPEQLRSQVERRVGHPV
jgi:GTP-binding protein HflX